MYMSCGEWCYSTVGSPPLPISLLHRALHKEGIRLLSWQVHAVNARLLALPRIRLWLSEACARVAREP